jgi:hypothetical protein
MRVLIGIGLLIAAAFVMMVSVLVELVCDLSRQSYQAPPDLDSSDDWDVEVDELADAAPPVAPYTEQLAVNRYHSLQTLGDDKLRNSNALDDLHSAL